MYVYVHTHIHTLYMCVCVCAYVSFPFPPPPSHAYTYTNIYVCVQGSRSEVDSSVQLTSLYYFKMCSFYINNIIYIFTK